MTTKHLYAAVSLLATAPAALAQAPYPSQQLPQ
jgi:hypothetical protein